jgi:hypothetical protein
MTVLWRAARPWMRSRVGLYSAEAPTRNNAPAPLRRGEVSSGRPKSLPDGNTSATVADVGLSSKDIHEARIIRDAEVAEAGIVRRTLDESIAAGEEPSKAKVKRAAIKAVKARACGSLPFWSAKACSSGRNHRDCCRP